MQNSGVSSANVLEKLSTEALHKVKLAPILTLVLKEYFYFS